MGLGYTSWCHPNQSIFITVSKSSTEDNILTLHTYVLKIKISGIQRMSEATISVSSPSKSDVDQRKLLSVQDCNKILRIKVCTVFCENNVECAKLSWMAFFLISRLQLQVVPFQDNYTYSGDNIPTRNTYQDFLDIRLLLTRKLENQVFYLLNRS